MAERYAHGLVIGKFYPFHSGHQALIRSALRRCERVTVQVLGASVETIPLDVRVGWVREEHPTARVVGAMDDHPIDFDSPALWDVHVDVMRAHLDAPVDAVLTSDAYGAELAHRLGAAWLRVDPDRRDNPVSGTAIRNDPVGHWAELPTAVRAWFSRRIVVLGAESTGTTTLAEALAERLGTVWVPEYGRTHTVIRPGGPTAPWRSHEFDLVMDRQMAREAELARRAPTPLLVCDTDALATTVWHERYVGAVPEHLRRRAAEHRPLGYVLTGDEIPFVQDGLRDGEHLRHDMHRRFREVLAAQDAAWLEVRGDLATRLEAAAAFATALLGPALAVGPSLEELQAGSTTPAEDPKR